MKNLISAFVVLLISSTSLGFIDPFKKPEKVYSADDIDIILSCDNEASNNENFYVLGEVKGRFFSSPQIFFNIGGKIKAGKSIKYISHSENLILMDGGFLQYQFDLENKTLNIVNRNGVVVETSQCRN